MINKNIENLLETNKTIIIYNPIPGIPKTTIEGILTYNYYIFLIKKAKKEIIIHALVFTLTMHNTMEGTEVYEAIKHALSKNIKFTIFLSRFKLSTDLLNLKKQYPQLVNIYQQHLFNIFSAGIFHQKMIIIDEKYAYLGSANMTEGSITKTIELGIGTCDDQIISELIKIHNIWIEFTTNKIKRKIKYDQFLQFDIKTIDWLPNSKLDTQYNSKNQKETIIANQKTSFFISMCPIQIAQNRTHDADAIIYTINNAEKFINLAIYEFNDINNPFLIVDSNQNHRFILDNRIKQAIKKAITNRGINVQIMLSKTFYTKYTYDSLKELLEYRSQLISHPLISGKNVGKLKIKIIEIPMTTTKMKKEDKVSEEYMDQEYNMKFNNVQDIEKENNTQNFHYYKLAIYAQHAKYIITDKRVNIGTSNMTFDYMYATSGMSFNTNSKYIINNVNTIFITAFNSENTIEL